MSSTATLDSPRTVHETSRSQDDRYARQAYRILHLGFVVAPVLAGADKFFNLLTNWTQYLSPLVPRLLPLSGEAFMKAVGVVEIAAGLIVAIKPKIGAYIVAAWLVGIIGNLLTIPGYFDVALRDLGLALGALALARLSHVYDR
jgi:hypothetical protein